MESQRLLDACLRLILACMDKKLLEKKGQLSMQVGARGKAS